MSYPAEGTSGNDQGQFAAFIDSSVNLAGTGGSVTSDLTGRTVTHTAGWNTSWAQWMNGNTGGFTCVTTLTWVNSTNGWVYKRPAPKA